MSGGILLALGCATTAFLLSGARSLAYLCYFLAYIPFITLDASTGGLTDVTQLGGSNVAFKMSMRILATAGIAWVAWRRRDAVLRIATSPASLPVLFLVAWALLGVHRAPAPWVPLIRLGELAIFFLTGVVLYADAAARHSPRTVMRWHCLGLAPLLLVTVSFALSQPELAFHTSSDGIRRMGHKFMNSNVLGFAANVVLLWSVFELEQPRERLRSFFHERVLPVLTLVLAAYVLYHARSRTATVTAGLGLLIVLFPYWRHDARRRAHFAAFAAIALLAVALNARAIGGYFLRGESAADVTSGTGRTGLWHDLVLLQVPEAPLLGAGYLSLSEQGGFFHAGHFWNNAHNTYLFALVSTGIPGLLAVLAIAVLPWFLTLRAVLLAPLEDRPAWALAFALQTVVVVASITGFGIIGYPNVAMFYHYTLFAFACGATRSAVPSRSAKEPRLQPLEVFQ